MKFNYLKTSTYDETTRNHAQSYSVDYALCNLVQPLAQLLMLMENYSLTVPDDAKILVLSYVGYISQEMTIGNSSVIDVILINDFQSLSDLVVVGYGTQKKRDLTGAISSVRTADIVVTSNSDIGHSLKGKAAGLMIRENSAQPGGGLDILVRGAGSINASNAPLIVIDGFPITDLQQPESGNRYQAGTQSILNSFNPNDIESIEVLKEPVQPPFTDQELPMALFLSLPEISRGAIIQLN